jgi:hypothetical protein
MLDASIIIMGAGNVGYSAEDKTKQRVFIPVILLCGFSVFLIMTQGCLDNFTQLPTTYESHPTQITYILEYGYEVSCIGSGRYDISYRCDYPEVLSGTTLPTLLYKPNSKTKIIANNQMIWWNLSGVNETTYRLGFRVEAAASSVLVPDLSGEKALDINDIRQQYPEITSQYTRLQTNDSIVFIEPDNLAIRQTVQQVMTNLNTTNAFEVAKAFFVWLKTNVNYQIHPESEGAQPSRVTLQKKTGDCDDLSFLYISLCRSAGIPARFIRGYLLDSIDGEVSATAHAWTEVFVGNKLANNGWIPVECACCTPSVEADLHQNFGIEKPFHLRLFIDDGSNTSLALALTGISVSYAPAKQISLNSFAEIIDYKVLSENKLIVIDDIRRYE